MSKAVAAAAVGVGGASIAVGGVYLSKMFNVDYVIPSELNKFTESNGGGCVQSIFPGIAKMQPQDSLAAVGNSSEVALNGDSNNADVNGCLVVNWDKGKNKDNNKGRGNFRFLGALVKGNKGFIVYATADTSNTTTDKKLKVRGVRYLLEKGQEGKAEGTIKKGKKVDETGKDLEGSKLVKPGSKLQGMDAFNLQWKFVDDDVNLDKLCTKDDCKEDNLADSFRGYWIFEKGKGSEAADKGTSNISDWWKVIYEEDTNWNMSTVLNNVNGEWKQKTLYRSPESAQKPETK